MSDTVMIAATWWFCGFAWAWVCKPAPRPSYLEEIGGKVVAGARSVREQAKFVGGGYRAVHTSIMRVDGDEVTLALSREGIDADR